MHDFYKERGLEVPKPAVPQPVPSSKGKTKKVLESVFRIPPELDMSFPKELFKEKGGAEKKETVIFIRDKNSHGQEVSGYIDYAHRLKTEDFEVYFAGKRRLLPRPTDMSFYNWDSHIALCNSSPNYQVIADHPEGLLFKYKRDRKILNVDPKANPGDNSTRIPIQTELYTHAVLYDHVSRRKT
ncbi:polycomb group RING finger protein 6 [Cricetulus griseus]|uniref:Cilia- and flagella-associated protein 299 n=1 Tax=Cricetulus griseus TaxID=10029 RepID=A0A061IN43_CRIGR|nr:polycomb group RING finger protein 6 [Cricetulus griseus]